MTPPGRPRCTRCRPCCRPAGPAPGDTIAYGSRGRGIGAAAGDRGIEGGPRASAGRVLRRCRVVLRRGGPAPGPLQPFPGAEVQLRSGELWVRSPYLALGYPAGSTGRCAATTTALPPSATWRAGRTAAGCRSAAAATRRSPPAAPRCWPRTSRTALPGCPASRAVAVVGSPHGPLGEVVMAVIEPAAGAELGRHPARSRAALHGQSLPRRWLLADRLPRTAAGKVAAQPSPRRGRRLDPRRRRVRRPPGSPRTAGDVSEPGVALRPLA